MKLSRLIVGMRPPRGPSGILGSSAITTQQLAAYQTTTAIGGYVKFANVPWGPCFNVSAWNEPTLGNALTQPTMDIYYDPRVAAPVGGRPVIVRAHANGNTKDIPEAVGSSMWDHLVVPAMARGAIVVTIEFRHPVPNENLGAPHNDTGYCVQFIRAMGTALNMNLNRFHGFTQSRGNLLVWQAVSADLADAGSSNFAKRQSSWVKSIWSINGQSTYNTQQYVDFFIDPADRAAAMVDPTYNFNPAFGSAYDKILSGERATLPFLCSTHDATYAVSLPSLAIGTRSKATIDGDDALRVHLPEFGKLYYSGYAQRGQTKNIVICDDVNGGLSSMADSVPWFFALDENPGITAKEAKTMVMIRRLGGSMHYIAEDGSGIFVSGANPTLVTGLGETVGAMPDGSYGYANRSNPTPLGATYKQTTATARPTLASVNAGARRGLAFDSVDDVMPIFLDNSSVDARAYTLTGEVSGASTRTSTRFDMGVNKVGGATVVAVCALPNTTFDATSLKFVRQFATEISGVTY